jgi:hypothetical protein
LLAALDRMADGLVMETADGAAVITEEASSSCSFQKLTHGTQTSHQLMNRLA